MDGTPKPTTITEPDSAGGNAAPAAPQAPEHKYIPKVAPKDPVVAYYRSLLPNDTPIDRDCHREPTRPPGSESAGSNKTGAFIDIYHRGVKPESPGHR